MGAAGKLPAYGQRREGLFWRRKTMGRLILILAALSAFVLAAADIMPDW